jgi:hypothetical protein
MTEKHFSPTTMYATAPSARRSSSGSPRTPPPRHQKPINATSTTASAAHRLHLFFRESKEAYGDLGAPAYLYAGPATYVNHTGERPMRIIWKLNHELPADVLHDARVATA